MRHEDYMRVRAEDYLKQKYFEDTPAPPAGEDMVNHPPHYNKSGIECIDAIKAALGEGFKAYCHGNIQKYLWRHPYKNGLEDLKKARWYLDKLIEEYEQK